MPEASVLLREQVGAVAVLKINRPQAYNAINQSVLLALREAVVSLRDDPKVRVVVLTGSGDKAFAAGADLAAMQNLNIADAVLFSKYGHEVTRSLEELQTPVIAAVQGFALGGGMELALACDFIWASDKATFGQPEVGVGVIPGWGGTSRLWRSIGMARARDLIMTGRKVSANEAREIGFVTRVFTHAEFMTQVMAGAQELASQSATAVAAVKRLYQRCGQRDLVSDLDFEALEFGSLFGGHDQREGMTAFLEKRKPKFGGQLS